jgi:hypothetical protein
MEHERLGSDARGLGLLCVVCSNAIGDLFSPVWLIFDRCPQHRLQCLDHFLHKSISVVMIVQADVVLDSHVLAEFRELSTFELLSTIRRNHVWLIESIEHILL